MSLKCDVDSNPSSSAMWQKDDGDPPVSFLFFSVISTSVLKFSLDRSHKVATVCSTSQQYGGNTLDGTNARRATSTNRTQASVTFSTFDVNIKYTFQSQKQTFENFPMFVFEL